ncbi:MAG: hypothetical protein FJX42_06790 [Alphaproteobacteria bacterium]|nr:hypothetical protein [Alphaproteobacteria bacterium]
MSLDITPLVPAGRQVIESYGGGGFRIAGVFHPHSVIVLFEKTLAWPVAGPAAIVETAFSPLFDIGGNLDILVVGCGPRFLPPPAPLRAAVKARGWALEWMDTGAACRTFNVLLTEGRPAAAALVAVE